MLSTRGLAALTVSDIAEQAGINRATFYAHYPDKYELFSRLIEQHFNAVLEEHATSAPELTEPHLARVLLAVCTFVAQVYEGCHVHDDEMEYQIERQVQRQLTDWVRTALAGSVQRPNSRQMAPETVAVLTANSLYIAASTWGRSPEGHALDRHIAESMVFVWGGVTATGFRPRSSSPRS